LTAKSNISNRLKVDDRVDEARDRTAQRMAGATFCGRSNLHPWTPQFGEEADLQGSPGKARSPPGTDIAVGAVEADNPVRFIDAFVDGLNERVAAKATGVTIWILISLDFSLQCKRLAYREGGWRSSL